MGKNLDKLGSLDDFTAPWETAGGGKTEIDESKLRKWIFNVLSDKAKAQDARDDAAEKTKAAETERDEAKAKIESGESPDLVKELDAERAKTAKETARADTAERVNLVTKVATDKGIPLSQATRLQGNTEEELAADADAFLKDFAPAKAGEGDGEGEGEGNPLESTPKARRTRNPLEDASTSGGKAVDYEAVAAQAIGSKRF